MPIEHLNERLLIFVVPSVFQFQVQSEVWQLQKQVTLSAY